MRRAFILLPLVSACGSHVHSVGGGGSGTADVSSALASAGEGPTVGLAIQLQPSTGKMLVHFTDAAETSANYGIARFETSGALDTTFGVGGVLKYTSARLINRAFYDPDQSPRVAVSSTGDIYVARSEGSMDYTDVGVAHYSKDGKIDAAFGGSGLSKITFGAASEPRALHVLGDGSIIVEARVLRSSPVQNESFAFGLAKLRPDGSADPAFAGGGARVYPDDPRWSRFRQFSYLLGDGSLFAMGGPRQVPGKPSQDPRILLLHYGADGTPDLGFGTNGVNYLSSTSWFSVQAMERLPHGFLVVTGTPNFCAQQLLLAAFLEDGTPDKTFGQGGVATAPYGACDGADGFQPSAVAIMPDGRIMTSAVVQDGFAYLRFDAHGAVDQSFGIDGFRIAGPPHHANEHQILSGLAVTEDGKVLSLGADASDQSYGCGMNGWCGAPPLVMITRLLDDGSPDAMFPE